MRVDSSGGTVSAPNGAGVVVPPDAIPDALEISVTTYESVADMPAEYHSSLVGAHGVADFGPDGAVFEKPVHITIPSPNPLNPGDEYRLYMWNDKEGAWQETEYVATVDPDGGSYSAEVTHFTTYTGSVQQGPDGYFLPLEEYWVEYQYPDPAKYDQRTRTLILFNNETNLERRFNRWVAEFPSKTDRELDKLVRMEDCCWQEVGLLFRYQFQDAELEYDFAKDKELPQPLPPDYHWREHIYKEVPASNGRTWSATIVIYWKSKAPKITLDPPQAGLSLECNKNLTQPLTIFTQCGDEGIPEAFIDIYVESGPGSITPENIRTDANGTANFTYSPDGDGIAAIAGQVSTCQQEPEPYRDEVDVEICVEECKDWDVTLSMSFSHSGGDVSWNFRETIAAAIPFEFDEESGEVYSQPAAVSRLLSIEAIDPECSIININAPSYQVELTDASITDGILTFGIMPEPIPLSFTWYCTSETGEEPLVYVLTTYGNLEGSVMGQELYHFEMALCEGEGGGVDESGEAGSEGFGEFDMPIIFSYGVATDLSCAVGKCDAYK